MSPTELDIETRVEAAMRAASARGPEPMPDLRGVVQRARRRRSRVGATAGASVLVVGALGVTAAVRAGGDDPGDIRSGRPDPSPTTTPTSVPATTAIPAPARISDDRPVLDQCTPSRALQMSAPGAPFSAPVARYEVFADPARGVTGPLVAVTRNPTPGGTSSTDGNTGGLRANSDIDGRDLTLQPIVADSIRGGATWDSADGGNMHLYSSGLDAMELRAVVEALDRDNLTQLPGGLVSIGPAGHVEWSRSDCHDDEGLIATITTYRGDAASRWAHVLGNTPGNVPASIFDDGVTSTLIFGISGRYDPSDTAYHQATPEEWARLLAASEQPPFAPPGTSRPASVEPPGTTAPS